MKKIVGALIVIVLATPLLAQPGNGNGYGHGNGRGNPPCGSPPCGNSVPIDTDYLVIAGVFIGWYLIKRNGRKN